MRTDRLSGAVLLLLGGLLWVIVIPWQVETVDYGWLRPRTMPYLMAIVIGVCGLVLVIRPGLEPPRFANWPRVSLFAGLLFAALWLIWMFGFIWIAPFMGFALMWAAGERRRVWLVAGTVGMPLAIWVCVVVLLERPLP